MLCHTSNAHEDKKLINRPTKYNCSIGQNTDDADLDAISPGLGHDHVSVKTSIMRAPDIVIEVAAVHTDAKKMFTIHEQNAFGILSTNSAHSGIGKIAGMAH
jgi:hypothetical protein